MCLHNVDCIKRYVYSRVQIIEMFYTHILSYYNHFEIIFHAEVPFRGRLSFKGYVHGGWHGPDDERRLFPRSERPSPSSGGDT